MSTLTIDDWRNHYASLRPETVREIARQEVGSLTDTDRRIAGLLKVLVEQLAHVDTARTLLASHAELDPADLLAHPETVTEACKVLEETAAGHDDMCPDFGQAVKLRASLEAVLGHCDELLAIVNEQMEKEKGSSSLPSGGPS